LRNQHGQEVAVEKPFGRSCYRNEDQVVEVCTRRPGSTRDHHPAHDKRHVPNANGFPNRIFLEKELFLRIRAQNGDPRQ
jgi:hypothetical protein